MLTSKQIEESERLDWEIGPRPDCRRENLTPRVRVPRTAQSERVRLEREVIGKARSLVGVTSGIDVPSILAGELGLLEGAVRRLLEFEASQHQVKK